VFSFFVDIWKFDIRELIWNSFASGEVQWVFTDQRFGEAARHLSWLVLQMFEAAQLDHEVPRLIDGLPVEHVFQILTDDAIDAKTHHQIRSILERIAKFTRLSWILHNMDTVDPSLPMIVDIKYHSVRAKEALQSVLWKGLLEEKWKKQIQFMRHRAIASVLFLKCAASDLAIVIIQVFAVILNEYPPTEWDHTFTSNTRVKMIRFIRWLVGSPENQTSEAAKSLTECLFR
jgi:hypothetical protein